MTEMCYCGMPLHYSNREIEAYMHDMVRKHGTHVDIICEGKSYRVPRHYIALHGINGWELDNWEL